jgi:hypothetical protein
LDVTVVVKLTLDHVPPTLSPTLPAPASDPLVTPTIVLFESVSLPANVASVPVVGNVTPVGPVIVNVDANAPDVARLPPSVMVFAPLLTPVPPQVGPIIVPFHVPDVIVPTCARLDNVTTELLTNVPDVGNVTDVGAVIVSVVANAPDVARLPASVSVFDPLLTPVPPYVGLITLPVQFGP